MAEQALRILQVSTAEIEGGAEKVARDLFMAYRSRGFVSRLAVGRRCSEDPDIEVVPNDECRKWGPRHWIALANRPSFLPMRFLDENQWRNKLRILGQPGRLLRKLRGHEDFDFPGIWQLLQSMEKLPDIVHCHNLHGDFFDLRSLPYLSKKVPLVLTLHDTWMLSGHCAYSYECERWKTGCGRCPFLSVYPAIRRDATAYNRKRKRDIYAKSRVYVSAPSRWLMEKLGQSILAPAIVEARVIPYGVDLGTFCPADRQTARIALGLPQEARMLLFTANRARGNIWKDFQTISSAVAMVAERSRDRGVIFVALGENAPAERIGEAIVRFIPYQKDPKVVARYYQAADVYVHAAKVDNFPNAVLEALACGTPAVATAVGGIPEQVEDGQTGFLVPPGDAESMAKGIIDLLTDDGLRTRFGREAAKDAQKRFDLNRQVDNYIAWYRKILDDRQRKPNV